jgi:hypothetical protein
LAAAYAEAGRFEEVVATTQKAMVLAEKNTSRGCYKKTGSCWNSIPRT